MTNNRYRPVAGHPNLVKDPVTGVVLNTNAENQRARKVASRKRMDDMESSLHELTKLVKELKDHIDANDHKYS